MKSRMVLCSLSLAAGFFFLAYFAVSFSTFFAAEKAATVEEFRALEMRNGVFFAGFCSVVLGFIIYGVLRYSDRQEARAAQLDEKLRGAERRLATSTLVHTVIHDTNNLLGVVRSGLMMMKDPDLPINRSALCDRMGTAVDRVEELHRQLMRREREMHDEEASSERFTVKEAFEELRSYARLHPRLKECRLEFRENGEHWIHANRTEFAQAVLNLVLNAADATGNRGHVLAEASSFHGHARITVDDDGPGVPEEERAKIFGAFYSRKKHGMGLGLMSVKGFCERSGGRVAVETSRWNGARFTMDLPLAPAASPSTPAEPAPRLQAAAL
jgi:signal transduction histidine kinase